MAMSKAGFRELRTWNKRSRRKVTLQFEGATTAVREEVNEVREDTVDALSIAIAFLWCITKEIPPWIRQV